MNFNIKFNVRNILITFHPVRPMSIFLTYLASPIMVPWILIFEGFLRYFLPPTVMVIIIFGRVFIWKYIWLLNFNSISLLLFYPFQIILPNVVPLPCLIKTKLWPDLTLIHVNSSKHNTLLSKIRRGQLGQYRILSIYCFIWFDNIIIYATATAMILLLKRILTYYFLKGFSSGFFRLLHFHFPMTAVEHKSQ